MNDRERSLAAYFGMLLRSRGYSPQSAAHAVVRRYPGVRADLEAAGLLPAPKSRLERWESETLARLMEGADGSLVSAAQPEGEN